MAYLLLLWVSIMTKSFLYAVENVKSRINSIDFMLKTRTKPTYFTRNSAKMNFSDAVYFILRKITKTMQIELDNFFEKCKESVTNMTKQAFSQLREKINPEAFIDLNDSFINWFYSDGDLKDTEVSDCFPLMAA